LGEGDFADVHGGGFADAVFADEGADVECIGLRL
jgi:hypothetical protein